MPNAPNFIDFLNSAPEAKVPREVRPRIKLLYTSLDQLLFVDARSELAADREVLLRIVNDDDLMPQVLRDVMLVETSKHLGQRIRSFHEGQRVLWRDAEKYGVPIQPPSLEDLQSRGLDLAANDDALEVAIRAQYRDLPDFWVDPDPQVLYGRVVVNLQANQTAWSCLVANLGFWVALNIIGTTIIALVMLGSGVPWPVVLACIIAFTGFNTAYFILQCIANPSYRA
jgi:hypothetical protein